VESSPLIVPSPQPPPEGRGSKRALRDFHGKKIFTRLASGEALRPEEMIILVLKAQTNHFAHLDQDLRQEMLQLRTDMDKRFEQVDKRFEQVDKRFDEIIRRMDRFMFWSLGITVAAAVFVVNYLK
jgi:ABC-type thiamine transport system ATPase subunit